MTTSTASWKAPTSLRERVAQLVMIRIGSNLPPIRRAHEDEERVARLLERCPVGGLLLFNGTWPQTRDAFERLQARSRVPLLVASDIERGAGQQMAGLTTFPHQRAFVDVPDAEGALGRFLAITAAEARASGIHATFGPVADVNTDPRNPIIATRAFGDDPERAGALVAAYVRAAQSRGLLATAKHFPGHGDTHQDSHDAMPAVNATGAVLRARELLPFRAAIDAGVALIMSAHVEYPGLDPRGVPATLSRPILTDVLRGELGFEGVVCSDSLLMAGVRERFADEVELASAALEAGIDLLLDLEDAPGVVDGLVRAVERGRLSAARVDEAFERVWNLKRRAFAAPPPPALDATSLAHADAEALAIARAATRVVRRDPAFPWPLRPDVPLAALLLKPHHRPTDPPEQPLAAALRERFRAVTYVEAGPETEPARVAPRLAAAGDGQPVLVAMIVKPAAWHAFGLSPAQRELVRGLLAERPVVLACLGVREALAEFPEAAVQLCTHSDVPCSQIALAERLVADA